MLLSRPFETVTPTVDGQVLAVLAGASEWFPLSRIHALADAWSRSGIRKSLQRLVEQGIVERQQLGSQYSYRLNRSHLAAPAVIELAGLYATYLMRLRSSLQGWPVEPAFAALFGSATRGDMRHGSDIDLFLVRPAEADPSDLRTVWDSRVADLAAASTSWTGNDTRVLEMSEAEVVGGMAAKDPVLQDIRAYGITLIGSLANLDRVHHG